MKFSRTNLFILITSFALLMVLVIQVNWMLQAAKMKEDFFNEKANIVLSKTAEALSSDKEAFSKLRIRNDSNEVHKIDSLFNYYMKVYNIHIDYTFEVNPTTVAPFNSMSLTNYSDAENGSYTACIPIEENNMMELKLLFPEKEQYIIAEMKTPFITSVILIIVVFVLSWRTISSLSYEKRISEHTTDYLNNMTHEFKTPLTNIALAGKMMLKDSNIHEDEKIKHYSGIILEENEKLHQQVEQVLSMTALERGEIPLHKTELDVHKLIEDSVRNFSPQLENRNGEIKVFLNADKQIIIGDKIHLMNAIANLLDNAIKYSGNNPKIFIQTDNEDNKLFINVSDNGIGIQKKFLKKIFDKYFRVPTGNVHDVRGFGLGLSYVKKIIELHSGKIEIFSKPDQGTTFTIIFPHA